MKKLRDLLYKVRGGAVKVIYPKYSKDSNESCNFDVFDRQYSQFQIFSSYFHEQNKTKTNFLYIVVSKVKVAKHESEKKLPMFPSNYTFGGQNRLKHTQSIVSARVYSQWCL